MFCRAFFTWKFFTVLDGQVTHCLTRYKNFDGYVSSINYGVNLILQERVRKDPKLGSAKKFNLRRFTFVGVMRAISKQYGKGPNTRSCSIAQNIWYLVPAIFGLESADRPKGAEGRSNSDGGSAFGACGERRQRSARPRRAGPVGVGWRCAEREIGSPAARRGPDGAPRRSGWPEPRKVALGFSPDGARLSAVCVIPERLPDCRSLVCMCTRHRPSLDGSGGGCRESAHLWCCRGCDG